MLPCPPGVEGWEELDARELQFLSDLAAAMGESNYSLLTQATWEAALREDFLVGLGAWGMGHIDGVALCSTWLPPTLPQKSEQIARLNPMYALPLVHTIPRAYLPACSVQFTLPVAVDLGTMDCGLLRRYWAARGGAGREQLPAELADRCLIWHRGLDVVGGVAGWVGSWLQGSLVANGRSCCMSGCPCPQSSSSSAHLQPVLSGGPLPSPPPRRRSWRGGTCV